MPPLSAKSEANLSTCDVRLQKVVRAVAAYYNLSVLEGHRSAERQKELFAQGLSKLQDGGKHNAWPSKAVDLAGYPIDWADAKGFHYLAGLMIGTAKSMNIKLRWGGDWNRNGTSKDEKFLDLVHFELDE